MSMTSTTRAPSGVGVALEVVRGVGLDDGVGTGSVPGALEQATATQSIAAMSTRTAFARSPGIPLGWCTKSDARCGVGSLLSRARGSDLARFREAGAVQEFAHVEVAERLFHALSVDDELDRVRRDGDALRAQGSVRHTKESTAAASALP